MAKAKIDAGICGHHTTVHAVPKENYIVELNIESDCKSIQKLAEHLTSVQALNEISFRKSMPKTLEISAEHCAHASCPVPSGIIKAIEVAAGLALPKDAIIQITDED